MAKKYAPAPKTKPQPKAAAPKNAAGGERAGLLAPIAALLIIVAACYWSSLGHEYVNWDDPANITENPNLKKINSTSLANIFDLEKGNVIGNYNPLSIFTFWVERWVMDGKISPRLTHLGNLALHLLTVLLSFRLLMLMGFGLGGAWIGALLMGIHPMRVESVVWATERKDVLFAAFFFMALILYVRWIKTEDKGERGRLYIVMLALALLSLLSKVQAVALPLSMLALDYWFRRPVSMKLLLEKTPFWLLSLAFGLINVYTLKTNGSLEQAAIYSFPERLCIGAYSFCVYLYKLLIPYPMLPLYPYPDKLPNEVYAGPLLFIAFWGLMWYLWKQDRRIWVFGALFFFFNVAFVLQVFGAGQGYLADRFTYVPYFGFFAITAWAYSQYAEPSPNKTLWQGVAGAVLIAFAFITVRQTRVWKNGETLWTHVIKHEGPTNSTAYWNRGQYLRDQKKYDQALKDYDQAIAINKRDPEIYKSRGKTMFDMANSGKYEAQKKDLLKRSIADYTTALSKSNLKNDSRAEMLINRGAARAVSDSLQLSLEDFNEGIRLDPDNENGYLNRSLTYNVMGDLPKADADYTSYLNIDDTNPDMWYERGALRRQMMRNQEAISDLNRALQIKPAFGLAYLERARSKAQAGDRAGAMADYEKAKQYGVAMNPFDQQLMGQQ